MNNAKIAAALHALAEAFLTPAEAVVAAPTPEKVTKAKAPKVTTAEVVTIPCFLCSPIRGWGV